jgi:Haem-binding domain
VIPAHDRPASRRTWLFRVTWRRSVLLAALLLEAAQLGRCERSNPPVDPALSVESHPSVTPATAAVLRRACMDCHSNETAWPAYSAVAPLSWVVWYDVDRARRYLNLSTFGRYRPARALVWVSTVCDAVQSGRMPLGRYVWAHQAATLSDADRQQLCDWATSLAGTLRSAGSNRP